MVFKRRDRPPISTRLREAILPRGGWRRAIEYLAHRLRRLPDTPHRIALGVAIGVFVSFTPFFGIHVAAAAALAWVLRANVVASLIGTLAGNPVTLPLIAPIALGLGRRILGYGVTGRDPSRIQDAFGQFFTGLWDSVLSLFGYGESEWYKVGRFVEDVIWPYLVGGLLPGLVAATIAYYATRPLVAAYQARRRGRMLARAHERLARQDAEPYKPAEGEGSTRP